MTTRLLNTVGITDLPLLRAILAIRQKTQVPSLEEVIESFVLLV